MQNRDRAIIYSAAFADRSALYKAFMGFVDGGGLFLPLKQRRSGDFPPALGARTYILVRLPDSAELYPASARVVWVNPRTDGAQRPAGIGVAFDKTGRNARLVSAIEAQLGAMLKSQESTYTV